MPLALAPHIHLAVIGDDAVLLDTAADAYLCVPDGRRLLRPTADRAAVSPASPDVTAQLTAAGFVDPQAPPAPRRRPDLPRRDLGDPAAGEPVSAQDGLRLAGALWDLFWRYRGRPLPAILAWVRRAAPKCADPDEVARLARVFQRAAVWLPMPRKCLVRSFVLLRFLQRSGQDARWVFGVTTWPFSAHCWLQLEDVALDDWAERLVIYEPILAVG
ncbi:lasso peptide biosynthesis B2 protein [Phenylobacterium sp.]|uniref:lasso peptide biosynthesis B2 protein n=1 Tax=Phenylobacterium sp. TaxID=1871053 RepID=UPI0025CBD847|nr:lasso peptide biosynthesis B2 protein [Phenylobacterium sp.]